jgi:hypothetical protein
VSRVRENRTHGSTGGDWKRNATASPRQPPTQPTSALLDALDELGIVAVKVGVLENFAKDVTAPKGPEFLPIALAAKVHEKDDAKQHAKRLIAAAGIPSSTAKPGNGGTEND